MKWYCIRTGMLVGAIVVLTGSVRADEAKKPAPEQKAAPAQTQAAPAAPAPAVTPAPSSCCSAPATCTVWVTEMVPEQYTCTKTVYRTECKQETYTAYRTECAPEVRTRCVTCYHQVCETVNETRTVCETVPVCEERTIMKTCTVRRPVTTMVRKCEDHGHYECQEVPCGPSLMDRFQKCFKKSNCCDPCACECCTPVRMKTVKVWVPCKVWVETPCTKMECVTECHPEVVKVNTCKKVYRTEVVPVTRTRCVPETKTENYTVMVSKCVPCPATRTVSVCVPHQETCTMTRMVCRKVAKEVPVTPCCETTCCCETELCCKKPHCKGLFSLFGK